MNTLHTPTTYVTRYMAPPVPNQEPETKLVMSRCHEYEGPEWEPEPGSPNAWMRKQGYKMIGTRMVGNGRKSFHIHGNRSCPAIRQMAKGIYEVVTMSRDKWDKLERSERCRHCQNSIVE